ncbi:hypothetical protein F4604DRAFT_1681249 [Suillus subluteus]|nr:hypothetical protein F4604DRAFT_1681249 [Suillus subluteus]
MSELEESLYALNWNNVAAISMLQFKREVTYVWQRQWSVMTYLYLAVQYFGIFLAMFGACRSPGGGLFYIFFAHHEIELGYDMFLLIQWRYHCLAEVILIWRLYAIYNQSKLLLYVLLGLFLPVVVIYIAMDIFLWSRPSAILVQEITITPDIKYCTAVFHIGPMPTIYVSIPIICYDIFLIILAIIVLRKHLREWKELGMKPNAYVVMIV